jgi:glutaredoxin-like protein
MPILEETDKEKVRERLARLTHPVEMLYFQNHQEEIEYSRLTVELLQTLTSLGRALTYQQFDLSGDAETAALYHIGQRSAIVIKGNDDYGIRFVGTPGGYELISLLHAIEIVGNRQCGLSDYSLKQLEQIHKPVHIEVLVTPSCPYCPSVVSLAHELAMANPNITATMIQTEEFPEIAEQYNIRSVPHIVLNGSRHYEGNIPEAIFVEQILDTALALP